MKPCIRFLAAHPVLTATAAWLGLYGILYGIIVAVQVYQGYELRGLEVPSTAPLVVVASVVGAGVGTLISRGVMRRRKSLGQRIISAALSLPLAIIAAFVVGLLVIMVEETVAPPAEPSDRGGSMALGIAVCVGGPTGLVFGFTGGALKKQIAARSDSRPLTP